MALRASALKGAVVAAICVALMVSWVGKPAQGSSSCAVHRCISECPSKCDKEVASQCESAKAEDEYKCRYYCGQACKDGLYCPKGTTPPCDCDSGCANECKSFQGSTYKGCVYAVSQQCNGKCEEECKGEKVNG